MAEAPSAVPDSHRDLLDRVSPAMVSTINPDGTLQRTPVWFLFENGMDRYLEVRGSARVDDDGEYAFADRIGVEYSSDMRAFDAPDDRRAAVTVVPVKVDAVDVG